MKKILPLFLLILLLPINAIADLVLIAHLHAPVNSISRDEVINIYMGRLRRFPTGESVQPVDGPDKAQFYRLLVNKELADINAYWARLVFSGRTSPPRTFDQSTAVVDYVSENPDAVGYIQRTELNPNVKVILEMDH
jgi:ABC-type phosphate transport system substrate-binding protein